MLGLRLAFSAVLIGLVWPAHAVAAVEITFLSKEFGASFPHAYVALKGTPDRGGAEIDANYGFTATHVSPAILMGSVNGEIISVDAGYMSKSDKHFTISLTDDQYDRVVAAVERWRTAKQPSYNLNRKNCVFFVADIAATLGMTAETPPALMKKPRSYLEMLTKANRLWLEGRGAKLLR
jgi:tryptophanyl-tRNA synthetase